MSQQVSEAMPGTVPMKSVTPSSPADTNICKNADFCNVTSCGCCENRRFGGTRRLHHQGKTNQRNMSSVKRNTQLKHFRCVI
jgi:hypothetical protein